MLRPLCRDGIPGQEGCKSGSRLDLGDGKQLQLDMGDVVFAPSRLAHRRAENWSEEQRFMLDFRLQPASQLKRWRSVF